MNDDHPKARLVFVSSCFDEEDNVRELHRRCREVHQRIQPEIPGREGLDFAMVIADNCSNDDTLAVLLQIAEEDHAVLILANASNYGPEVSTANALSQTQAGDVVVVITSDLQDPPELVLTMVQNLLLEPGCDAVLATKKSSSGSPMLRLCRNFYYLALGYTSRLRIVPRGYHGFGVYRHAVIEEALNFWQGSGMNLRMCLVNSCHAPRMLGYSQQARYSGRSSYQGWDYPREALKALLASDSTASRLAFGLSAMGVISAGTIAFILLVNWLQGNSRYEPGTPTVMALVLGSFAMQMLIVAVLSKQVEELRFAKFRPKVRTSPVGKAQPKRPPSQE